MLDGARLRSFFTGGNLLDNNLAAGTRESNSPANELTAVINQPSGEYTVVIYNDTDIPMTFRLWVENGAFPMEEGEMEQSAAQPESSPSLAQTQPQTAALSRDASADPVYTVQAGDTLSLIAQSVYSDLALYDRLCRYNSIINCNLIAVG